MCVLVQFNYLLVAVWTNKQLAAAPIILLNNSIPTHPSDSCERCYPPFFLIFTYINFLLDTLIICAIPN